MNSTVMTHLSEHLLLEELELLDNITSCNVVDNYLMLDEYEQNLIKEGETPGGGGGGGMRGRLRKWSLVRQPSVGGVQVGQVTFSVSWLNLKNCLTHFLKSRLDEEFFLSVELDCEVPFFILHLSLFCHLNIQVLCHSCRHRAGGQSLLLGRRRRRRRRDQSERGRRAEEKGEVGRKG